MKKEYIEKNALERLITPIIASDDCSFETAVRFIEAIDSTPVCDVALVRRGRWILEREANGKPYCLHCSVCDDDFSRIDINTAFSFCPHCGAIMNTEEIFNV